jgi:DNA-binding LytR/AlgR family response regulator
LNKITFFFKGEVTNRWFPVSKLKFGLRQLFYLIKIFAMNLHSLHEIIALPTSEGLTMTQANKVRFVKSNGNYCEVNLDEGERVLITRQLNELEAFLLNNIFIRVHQQYLVNKIYVNQYIKKDSQLILTTGEKIPVATRKRKLISTFFRILG